MVSGLPSGPVNVDILLAFLEYLHQNNLTVSNIANYLAANIYYMVFQLKALGMKICKCSFGLLK